MSELAKEGPLLFFDGQCGLCAHSVAWCLRHDRRDALRFAPLQGTTYASLDIADKPRDVATMVLADADGLHVRADAVLRMMHYVGGFWAALALVGQLLPRPVRDAMYNFVARRRLAWFGPADACTLPSEDQRGRFLP